MYKISRETALIYFHDMSSSSTSTLYIDSQSKIMFTRIFNPVGSKEIWFSERHVLRRDAFFRTFYAIIVVSAIAHDHALWRLALSLEQCSQYERFRQQHIQMVNKTSSFKTKVIGNNALASRVNRNTLWRLTFPRSNQQTPRYNWLHFIFWAEELARYLCMD